MENPKKRKRGKISCIQEDVDDVVLTQSKTTRRQQDIDA